MISRGGLACLAVLLAPISAQAAGQVGVAPPQPSPSASASTAQNRTSPVPPASNPPFSRSISTVSSADSLVHDLFPLTSLASVAGQNGAAPSQPSTPPSVAAPPAKVPSIPSRSTPPASRSPSPAPGANSRLPGLTPRTYAAAGQAGAAPPRPSAPPSAAASPTRSLSFPSPSTPRIFRSTSPASNANSFVPGLTPRNSPAPAATSNPRPPALQPPAPAAAGAEGPSSTAGCVGANCDLSPPHITIATPAPAPAPWPWQDRIAWIANLVLVVLGYAGVMLVLSLLKKIEQHMRGGEVATAAAAESAQAALLFARAMQRAERPWIMTNVQPSQSVQDGFTIVAANRGRGPARIVSTVDESVIALDERHLPPTPAFKNAPSSPAEPVILLPGETVEIASFSRGDVKKLCGTAEQLSRVENWEERIYLYGNLVYRDLDAPEDAPAHESAWCFWYIHGRQKSGMVTASPPAYHRHT